MSLIRALGLLLGLAELILSAGEGLQWVIGLGEPRETILLFGLLFFCVQGAVLIAMAIVPVRR